LRVGHGFDVHRLTAGRKLILGGVEIPFDRGLLGHSDADVLTHAVMDAILGALGADDIGTHFPDTDAEYKNISSLVLLERVVGMMHKANYRIGNIDALLHADKPKVKEYIPAMRETLARVLECDERNVNVKATTWEGLGFAGTGEGMAASAVCILYPDPVAGFKKTAKRDVASLFPDEPSPDPKAKQAQRTKLSKRVRKKEAFEAYIDGASRGNPGPSAIGVIVRDPEGIILAEISEAIGEATNNVAEYQALIRALEECRLLKAQQVIVYTDSELLERQINGKYKVKTPHLMGLFEKVMKLASCFEAFAIEHVLRDKNKGADMLANSALKSG